MLTIAQQQDWRTVWRTGIAPFATTEGLRSLALALRDGDARLVRRRTVEPLYVYPHMRCLAGCPLLWLGWCGEPDMTVGEALRAFDALLALCASATGSRLAAQSVIDRWDGWGGTEYDAEPLPAETLLVAVLLALEQRKERHDAHS